MDPSSEASNYFLIKGLPVAHAEALAKWAANTSVCYEMSTADGTVDLLMERKRSSTALQLKHAVRKLFHRSKCKADLPQIEALTAADYQAASAVDTTEGTSQVPLAPKSATVGPPRTCAMEALEGAETVLRLPAGFDKIARERYLQLRSRAELGH